ncbi:MAG TPA: histidinol-phosphatase HisJ family protein [Oscillospiraceae bacterium]|nr:histidinol-phosphatase HisJ family protein [Oscillospiraceae bacterium]
MYHIDYHTHSSCSPDADSSMSLLARAAICAGLDELCITDHIDLLDYDVSPVRTHDWAPAREQFAAARERYGDQLILRFGVELGEATEDFEAAARILGAAPELDFVLGSIHNTAPQFGRRDFYFLESEREETCRAMSEAYLEELLLLAEKGDYDALSHVTLPLRYFRHNLGLDLSFGRYTEELRAIFTAAVRRGKGIELNTNCGKDNPLPGRDELLLYRACGGEIITVGSDAHDPRHVGAWNEEALDLLRDCGFHYITAFERRTPVFHKI